MAEAKNVKNVKDRPVGLQAAEPSASGPMPEANGRAASYEQSVAPTGPPTRADVEARLRAASDSISLRLEAIQSEFGLGRELVKAATTKPLLSVAFALGAGFVVGSLFRSRSDKSGRDSRALTDLLTHEVDVALEEGRPIEEAISQVVSAASLGHHDGGEGRSLVGVVGVLALRSVVRQVVTELAERFRDKVSEPETDDSAAES